MDQITSLMNQISEHAWLLGVTRALGLIVGTFLFYHLIMSRMGRGLRRLFPFLNTLYVNKIVRKHTLKGEFALAGNALLEANRPDKAVEIFQRGRLYTRAADVYLKNNMHQKAALMFQKAGELKKAASIYISQKQHNRLGQMFAQHNAFEDLAHIYVEHGDPSRAAEMFQKSNNPIDAAKQFAQAGRHVEAATSLENFLTQYKEEFNAPSDPTLHKKMMQIAKHAASLFEKEKYYEKASGYYLKSDHPKDAARCLDKAGKHEKAGQLAKQHGFLEEASQYYQRANLDTEAARLEAEHLYQNGEFEEALEKYKIAGDFTRCAQMYTDVQDYFTAAEMHEKAGDYPLAADMFKDEKDLTRAGQNYEKAGMIEQALQTYQEGKLEHLELDLLNKENRFVDLAAYFLRRKLLEQSLSALERVQPHDQEYQRASSIKGQVFYVQKKFGQAREQFESALENVMTLDGDHLDTLFFFAKCDQDAMGQALETIENKMAMNQIEPEAMDKAKKIRKLIQEKSFSRLIHQTNPNFSGAKTIGPANKPNNQLQERYQSIKEIGRGGMGIVYLAKDKVLGREIALKVLPAQNHSDQRNIDTFYREAKTVASLNHPNIVTVFDTGLQGGDYFIAMEHIDGFTIKKILKQKGKFSIAVTKEVLKQLVKALSYAHKNSVVHRDLTTSNIMLTKQKVIKIMDFGLAKFVRNLQSEQSIIGGTPSFMSPEQTLGNPVDHRTDIYSLGICMFEMLLGALPFTKGSLGYHHLNTAPPVPNEIDPDVPQSISDAILKCMQKKPEDRYQSVEALIPVIKAL